MEIIDHVRFCQWAYHKSSRPILDVTFIFIWKQCYVMCKSLQPANKQDICSVAAGVPMGVGVSCVKNKAMPSQKVIKLLPSTL